VQIASNIKKDLQKLRLGRVLLENSGNIGKSYRRHDEIGTPLCITVDFDTLEDNSVTLRDRDTMQQTRIEISKLSKYLEGLILK
jgi:glycyl-tRNA synthetase